MPERFRKNVRRYDRNQVRKNARKFVRKTVRQNVRKNVREYARKNVRIETARVELEASGRGFSHGHWELWGVSLAMQSAIEEFAHKPGADGRSRGGGKEAEEGGGDEADIKSNRGLTFRFGGGFLEGGGTQGLPSPNEHPPPSPPVR